jgi:outer membrane biosynthesis protein TonB
MSKDGRFWRNVTLIGVAHVAVVYSLMRWNRETKRASTQSIMWMNGGTGEGAASSTRTGSTPTPLNAVTPTPEPSQINETNDGQPVLTSAKSEIQLPTPRPSPTAPAKPTPTPVVKVTPKPTPKSTPKPTPKPTIKPKPKPTPKKTTLAKASPKPLPKLKPTPEESQDNDEQAEPGPEKKDVAQAAPAKIDSREDDSVQKKASTAQSGSDKGISAGTGGHAGGAGGESQFGWYGSMLHDRFYSEWVQPATVASSKAKTSVLVKIRIEKDGRVSNFETISKRVTQVDPLPAGLGNGEHYDVKINFELNSEQ